jgi:flavin-dependent thymidylate synthase
MQDYKNKVELIGSYGGDLEHALSAWTSTSRDLTPEKQARIPALLKQLAEAGHHTVFEKSALHFLVTTDIADHIFLLKHRIGVSINGESARYKELKEDRYYVPLDWPQVWQERLHEHTKQGLQIYHECIASLTNNYEFDRKRAKESARYFRNYNTQITADVMFNFRSFAHFYNLRADEAAQKEIRWIAEEMRNQIASIPGNVFKYTLEAFGMDKPKDAK